MRYSALAVSAAVVLSTGTVRAAEPVHIELVRGGKVFGERRLLHDHADEQPFTRDLYGVTIPPRVRVVVVQARDQKYGYGGKMGHVSLPGR